MKYNKEIPKNSSLLPFKPFMHDSLIRVGGRIKHADLPFNIKHQIITHHKHRIASLILRDIHERYMHTGRHHILSLSREHYWISKGCSLGRKIASSCLTCKRRVAKPVAPLMADLPTERLSIKQQPFTYTGVDYFGPIYVKFSKKTRSNQAIAKRYGVIFTCLTVRAVHIELASDLTTEVFLLTLRRFIARRGKPKEILSDNGSNFIGADRQLREALGKLGQRKIYNDLSSQNIIWKFNAPLSPWKGGAWESMVKLTKKAMKAVMKDRTYHEESLITLLCEIEAMLNSRPLLPCSNDPSDFDALTPNDFIIEKFDNFAPGDFNEDDISSRKKFKSVQSYSNEFWRRFIKEYITSLNKRTKWFRDQRNFEVGDLVLIHQNNIPRSHWPLGRITKFFLQTTTLCDRLK